MHEVEFLDLGRLRRDIVEGSQHTYNVISTYRQESSDQIIVSSPRRMLESWDLDFEDRELTVTLDWPRNQRGVFRRAPSFDFSWIAIGLSLYMMAGACIRLPSEFMRVRSSGSSGGASMASIARPKRALHFAVLAIGFLVGLALGILIWSAAAIRRIPLPWDAVITVQLALILVIVGLRASAAPRLKPPGRLGWTSLLVSGALLGAGVMGTVVGVIRLWSLLELGRYL